jgi:hypothetical protein
VRRCRSGAGKRPAAREGWRGACVWTRRLADRAGQARPGWPGGRAVAVSALQSRAQPLGLADSLAQPPFGSLGPPRRLGLRGEVPRLAVPLGLLSSALPMHQHTAWTPACSAVLGIPTVRRALDNHTPSRRSARIGIRFSRRARSLITGDIRVIFASFSVWFAEMNTRISDDGRGSCPGPRVSAAGRWHRPG